MTLGELYDKLQEIARLEARVERLEARAEGGFDAAEWRQRVEHTETLLALLRSEVID